MYVVVLLTAEECELDPTSRCVMTVIGPFTDEAEAEAVMKLQPGWSLPHLMTLTAPEHAAHGQTAPSP